MKDNVVEKLGDIKVKLREIKELIVNIKTEDSTNKNKTNQLIDLHNKMTQYTCDFLDSIKIKTPSPIKPPSVKNTSPKKTKIIKIKSCPEWKILNPATNRCVDKKSKIGKMLSN